MTTDLKKLQRDVNTELDHAIKHLVAARKIAEKAGLATFTGYEEAGGDFDWPSLFAGLNRVGMPTDLLYAAAEFQGSEAGGAEGNDEADGAEDLEGEA